VRDSKGLPQPRIPRLSTVLEAALSRSKGRGRVDAVMRRLGRAVAGFEEPAVEKIAQGQKENAFQVLIATMLSAQTRDAVTHEASTRLFKVARTPRTLGQLPVEDIERLIYPVSFYRNKAVHVKAACQQIVSRFGGRVPDTMDALLALPGVGRKTANLVLILAHRSEDNICVDTHVHRISNRLGWVATRTPEETEQQLYRVVRRKWWPLVNLYLVTWGQNVCRPLYPRCGSCVVVDLCPKIAVVVARRGFRLKAEATRGVSSGLPPFVGRGDR
jgi:endonuclease III